jgi:hypothetical protein
MAPRKQPKTITAKKTSARRAAAGANIAGKEVAPLGQLPFPYEVKKNTLKDTITRYLETEVAKHHDTSVQLEDTTVQLENALRQLEALKNGDAGKEVEPGAGGKEDLEQDEEDDEDEEMDDGEAWTGISGAGAGHSNTDDIDISGKVQSLEQAMAQMAKGLRDVSTTVNRGFQDLAAGNHAATLNMATTHPDGPADHLGDGFDSDADSFAITGGKSAWDDLMARYDSAGEKDMLQIARGEIMPEKIYLCIPRDSDLFPEVTEEANDKVRWDEEGLYLEKKSSAPYDKTKVFRNLRKAIATPLHFQHAWGWFMVLVNYHYKDPALNSAMMQFGAEVAQYAAIYQWEDCLKVYVNLGRPILRGNLDRRIKMFNEANFAGALSKCARMEKLRGPLANPGPNNAGLPPRPTPPPVFIDGVEVCRRFQKGYCDASCPRRHACMKCRSPMHKAYQCTAPGAMDSSTVGPVAMGMAPRPSQPTTGFQPRTFGQGNGVNVGRQSGRGN